MYGELKCFIKSFTMLETSSNSLNSHQKILQKNPVHDFRSVENYFRSIECSFRSVEQELSSDRDIQKLQDFFFTISIDRAKASTSRNSWNLNFHKENSRIQIFTLFILQMNTLQLYIIITTYPCIYLYIQQQIGV